MSQLFNSITDEKLAQLVQNGAIGVLPTDTVYGLVSIIDRQPLARLYATKPRRQQAGTIIAATVEDLIALGLDAGALQRVAHLWPAPLSVVVEAPRVARYIRGERSSLAVRIPADGALRALLAKTGPLMTTSANRHQETTVRTAIEAQQIFGDKVDFYVDGGVMDGLPSTIVAVNASGEVKLLREGAVAARSLNV